MEATGTRITMRLKHPNPLFEKWLTEWRDRARESESKMQHTFAMALKSLKKYPLPLDSGRDCKILYGFGEKLCKMLDDKLANHRAENPDLDATQIGTHAAAAVAPPKPRRKNAAPQARPGSASKEYVPQYGSGPFAILVTLYEATAGGHMTKADIVQKGQHLSDKSFTKPDPGSRYTAWSSMKTLLDKKLVSKQGNPAKFSLTSEGAALADKLYVQLKIEEFKKMDENDPPAGSSTQTNRVPPCDSLPMARQASDSSGPLSRQPSSDSVPLSRQASSDSVPLSRQDSSNSVPLSRQPSSDSVPLSRQASSNSVPLSRKPSSNSVASSSASSQVTESVIMAPNSFKIVLLIDTQEVSGKPDDPLLKELTKLQVAHEVRNLKVGDYLWICRDPMTDTELALPYVVERKRMDDFGGSIKDGRFHEQKFRLKQSGAQNLIYLVESYGRNEHVGLPPSTLYQAATNTLVQDGFCVKFTENLRGTVEYLAALSSLIVKHYKNKTVVSCGKNDLKPVLVDDDLVCLMAFKEFNKSSAKTKKFKVKEMFVRQLLQIKGLSVEKALAIVEKYPTPALLRLAYSENGPAQNEKLLSAIQYGTLKKKVGPILSKIVYQFFSKARF